MERTLSLRSILLSSLGVLAGVLVFAGPASAGTVTVRPTVQGAGTITAGGYSCSLLLPVGAQPKNSDASLCPDVTATAGQIPLFPSGFIYIPAILTITADPTPGWRFMSWQGCTPDEGGAARNTCTSIVRGPSYLVTPRALFREIVPVTYSAKPEAFTNATTPSFTFSSPGADSFTCALDGAPVPCGPGSAGTASFTAGTPLSDGAHSFAVRATKNTNVSIDAAVANFTVDTVAPTTTLDPSSGPGEGALQAVNVETFKFSASEPGTFECRLDSAAFAPCDPAGVRVDRLSAGAHRFEARAIDRAGNVGAVTARTWTVAAADDDNDGFNARSDCNDTNPGIFPGAADAVGNGIDENCDGADASAPVSGVSSHRSPEQVLVTVSFFSAAKKTSTKFTTLAGQERAVRRDGQRDLQGQGLPVGPEGQGLHEEERLRHGVVGQVHQEAVARRRHDHRPRLQAGRDQRRQDPQDPRVEEAADHDQVRPARGQGPGRLLNAPRRD